jgi:hypothetical protein
MTGTPVVFPGAQCPVPRQQRVRRHNCGHLPQQPSSECPGFRGKPTALVIREAQTPGPELFPQNAVFLLEAIDDIALLPVHPTGERDQNELQCDESHSP